MPDDLDKGIVAEALDQCTVDFERGLNSHGSPTFTVPRESVDGLRRQLTPNFHRRLVTEKRRWHGSDGDGRRVTRIAFYLGAIAAFHAEGDAVPDVTQEHVERAFDYVQEHCQKEDEDVDIRGIYCD